MLASRVLRSAAAAAAPEIKRVGVVGLGLMGHGILQTSAAAGYQVIGIDNEAGIAKGMDMVKKSLETIAARKVKKNELTPEKAKEETEKVLANITTSAKREALADVDLVIEAVPEVMTIKEPVLKDIARVARPSAIIASNTSGLPIGAMAAITGRPQTTCGLHYFNPVQLMQLVEVVKLDSTPQSVVDAVVNFVKSCGKAPVLCKDTVSSSNNCEQRSFLFSCRFMAALSFLVIALALPVPVLSFFSSSLCSLASW